MSDEERELEEAQRRLYETVNSANASFEDMKKANQEYHEAAQKLNAAKKKEEEAAKKLAAANEGATNSTTALSRAFGQADQIISKSSKSLQEGFDKLTGLTTGLTGAFTTFTGAVLSSQAGVGKFGGAVGQAGDAMAGLVKEIPVLGAAFGAATKILTTVIGDVLKLADNMTNLKEGLVSTAGALPVTTSELINLASEARYYGENMQKLQKITSGLGTSLVGLGASAGAGATKFMEMANVSDDTRKSFLRLGISQEALTDMQAKYVQQMVMAGQASEMQHKSASQLKKESLEYAKELNRLSGLTGKSADELQRERDQVSMVFEEQLKQREESERIRQLEAAGDTTGAARIRQEQLSRKELMDMTANVMGPEMANLVGRLARTGIADEQTAGLVTLLGGDALSLKNRIQSGEGGKAIFEDFFKNYGSRSGQMASSLGLGGQVMGEEMGRQLGLTTGGMAAANLYGGMSIEERSAKIAEDQRRAMESGRDKTADQLADIQVKLLDVQQKYQEMLSQYLPQVTEGLQKLVEQMPKLFEAFDKAMAYLGGEEGLWGVVKKLGISIAGVAVAFTALSGVISGLVGGLFKGGGGLLGGGGGAAAFRGLSMLSRAAPWISGLMVGKDAYDWATAEGPAKKEDVYGTVGGGIGALLGGGLGFLAGGVGAVPGAAIGAGIGNMIGNWWGGSEDQKAAAQKPVARPAGSKPITGESKIVTSADQLNQQYIENTYLETLSENTEMLKKISGQLDTILSSEGESGESDINAPGKTTKSLTEVSKAFDSLIEGIGGFYTALTGKSLPGGPAGPPSGGTPTTGAVDANMINQATSFFQSKGWTKEQAAGIVGNLITESKLNPNAVGDGGKAYGIAQWHPDRQAAFAQKFGKDIRSSTLQEQLEFVDWELRSGNEKAAGNALARTTTASEAAAVVDQQYERSSGAARSERIANAEAILSGNLQPGVNDALGQFGRNLHPQAGIMTDIVSLGRQLQSQNLRVSEHPVFGGVTGGHKGRAHYEGRAIDVNAVAGRDASNPAAAAILDSLKAQLTSQGYTVLWRVPGHYDHMHVQVGADGIKPGTSGVMGAARGGVFKGPKSGYPMELHGTEMVTPLSPNSLLMELGKMPANMLKEDTAGIKNNKLTEMIDFEKVVNRIVSKESNSTVEAVESASMPIKQLADTLSLSMKQMMQSQKDTLNLLAYKLDDLVDSMQTSNKHTKKIAKKAG